MFWWFLACAPVSTPCGPAIADGPPPTAATELDAILADARAAVSELDYAQGPIAEYERETDHFALTRGCGSGLITYREWRYDPIPPDAVAEKRRDYLTPEEIRAWMEQNG